jgi:signal transduction histidine kinase
MTTLAIPHTDERREPRVDKPATLDGVWRGVLRVPLLWKLLGANLVLVVGMLVAHFAMPNTSTAVELGVLLVLSAVASSGLVWLALRPLSTLEATAELVSGGDFSARSPDSPLADQQMRRLTATVNKLLDRVESDRARITYLAGRGVRAREIEREAVARELRDSFAQTLAGIAMQISAAQRVNTDEEIGAALQVTRSMVQDLTEEMRSVAETLYPGTLAEFGLVNAIEALARRVSRRSGLTVRVESGMFAATLPAQSICALYRVAEEALRNVEQHGNAQNVRVELRCNGHVTLDIEDDGRGIDMRAHDPLQAGLGLFSAKAVLALSGGELQISSGAGLGTRVTARVPSDAGSGPAGGHHRNAQ